MATPRVETARLVLRALRESDAPHVVRLHGDQRVMRYIGRPVPRAAVLEQDLPRLLHRDDRVRGPAYWAAEDREGGRFVGWFELRPTGHDPDEVELGYRLVPEAWGRGYATEGAAALVRRAFVELGMARIVATTMAINVGSRRVLEKVGLRLVRIVHDEWADPLAGAELGDVEYALTRAEWEGPAPGGRPPSGRRRGRPGPEPPT